MTSINETTIVQCKSLLFIIHYENNIESITNDLAVRNVNVSDFCWSPFTPMNNLFFIQFKTQINSHL